MGTFFCPLLYVNRLETYPRAQSLTNLKMQVFFIYDYIGGVIVEIHITYNSHSVQTEDYIIVQRHNFS